jgi:hypothetical protein
MRKNKTHETTHKSDDYHTRANSHTRPRKRTIIALGLLRELGQVDITLSFLLCSHAGCFYSLVATRTRGRMQRRTLAAKKRSIPLPRRCTNSADAGRATEESATQSAKWPAADQELLQCAPCSSYRPATLKLLPPCHPAKLTATPSCHPATLPPYHPATLPPPSANRGKKTGPCLHDHASLYNWALSFSLIPSDWQIPLCKNQRRHAAVFATWLLLISGIP